MIIFKLDKDDVPKIHPRRHVYFSSTRENPFLPDWYIDSLEEDMDPKLARRMIYGEWIEIATETIYHQMSEQNDIAKVYQLDLSLPIWVSFDFNIALGKPMSACLSQFDPTRRVFHFFAESIVEGADTEAQMEEMANRGLFNEPTKYVITGDAAGRARQTASKRSDYDIITGFLDRYRTQHGPIDYQLEVPRANPPIRTRHNLVNAYLRNQKNQARLYCYAGTETLKKGLRLTALKKGGQYIEDDTKPYQHVTTALGYNVCWVHSQFDAQRKPTVRSVQSR